MPTPPVQPKIYHITHVDNLQSIIAGGGLSSDAAMAGRGGPEAEIGMTGIKRGRLTLPVKCHPGDHVGDYVPFYFCPRSVMLFVIYCANHPELAYRGGQGPIVHLEADLHGAIEWANTSGRRWAFSLSNAGAAYTEFRSASDRLNEVNWPAVAATDWRDPETKEDKQAEFLVRGFFPWELIERIGVRMVTTQKQVLAVLNSAVQQPPVEVRLDWYY